MGSAISQRRGASYFDEGAAAALVFADEGFRKVRGYRHLPHLKAMLNTSALDTHKRAA